MLKLLDQSFLSITQKKKQKLKWCYFYMNRQNGVFSSVNFIDKKVSYSLFNL